MGSQNGVSPKNDEAQKLNDSLNGINELELEYMEHEYMHMKGHGKAHGTSRNLKVMVKLHMVSVDMIKMVKRNFKSLRLVYLFIQLIMLIHD